MYIKSWEKKSNTKRMGGGMYKDKRTYNEMKYTFLQAISLFNIILFLYLFFYKCLTITVSKEEERKREEELAHVQSRNPRSTTNFQRQDD